VNSFFVAHITKLPSHSLTSTANVAAIRVYVATVGSKSGCHAGEDVASGADLDGLPEAKALAEEEADSEDEAGGGLIVELDEEQAGRRSSGAALARQWFAQEAFQVCF
jgi:hypothetical protein